MLAAVIRFIQRSRAGATSASPPGRKSRAASALTVLFLFAVAITSLLYMAWAGAAHAVDLDIGEASGTVGDTVIVEITTEDLTGLEVFSYELQITWYGNRATLIDAPVSGTITESWGPVTLNTQSGQVDLAAAGTVALSGGGTLINLKFVLGPEAYNTYLYFDDFMFNEGDPADTLTDGYLTISPLPTISISPNSGEVVVGDSLEFSTSGGTPPYTYGTTDPAVADFAGTDHLKGISPGAVYAFVEDDGGATDITTGQIFVRPFKIITGSDSGMPGDTLLVPIVLLDPASYDIKSAEFAVTYNDNLITALGTVDQGTIAEAAGWGSSYFNVTPGRIDISMAGTNSLPGIGILVFIKYVIDPVTYNTTSALSPTDGLFNEVYTPLHVAGSINITAYPVITAHPNTGTIVVGDELDFSVSGPATPPLDWGVTNPAVAVIDQTGKLTALASGMTRVSVVDDIGATDTTDVITICDLYVVAPEATIHTVFPTAVPISPDRDVTGLDIYGFELILGFNGNTVEVESVTSVGSASEGWGEPTVNTSVQGEVTIVHAGSVPLSGSMPLVIVNFEGLPGYEGTYSSLYINYVLFNEGEPCALVQNGRLDIVTGTSGVDVPRFNLEQNFPNPFNPTTVIRYSLAERGWARLQVFSPDGGLIKTLVNRFHETATLYEVEWDGTNNRGERVASGVYLYRLEEERRALVKKMVLIK